jgi:hypothetical protein
MGEIKKLFARLIALGTLLLISHTALSAPVEVFCPSDAMSAPDPSPYDRIYGLTTDPGSTCVAWGTGNVNGDPGDPFFLSPEGMAHDYVFLDNSGKDITENPNQLLDGVLTGDLDANAPTGNFALGDTTGYTRLVLALRGGGGGPNGLQPIWAAFLLPDGVTSGDWEQYVAIGENDKNLSHAILYGVPTPVPVPAALWLFGSGLLGLAGIARRRRKA